MAASDIESPQVAPVVSEPVGNVDGWHDTKRAQGLLPILIWIVIYTTVALFLAEAVLGLIAAGLFGLIVISSQFFWDAGALVLLFGASQRGTNVGLYGFPLYVSLRMVYAAVYMSVNPLSHVLTYPSFAEILYFVQNAALPTLLFVLTVPLVLRIPAARKNRVVVK